jgi:SAM-dependent methyltransferase
VSQTIRRHTGVLRETVIWSGRRLLEVGCGDARLLGWAVREGAQVVGLDPLYARPALVPRPDGLPLVAGRGEALPFASGRFDLVLFFNSLHHVPLASQWRALAEAARVLERHGELLVVEPLPEGEHFALLQPVDDETEVRREVFRAMHAAGALGLRMALEGFYVSRIVEPSWEAVRGRFLAVNPTRASALAAAESQARELFGRLGEPAEGGRAFLQPMRLNLLRRD